MTVRLSGPALIGSHSSTPAADGLLLWAQLAEDIDRLLQQQHAVGQLQAVPCCQYVQVQFFPYLLPSVGPGGDPGVQAVSPQVT